MLDLLIGKTIKSHGPVHFNPNDEGFIKELKKKQHEEIVIKKGNPCNLNNDSCTLINSCLAQSQNRLK
jgi:hypothetical protein